LKRPEGREVILRLCEKADGFVEGFRPGVAEKLGVGPKECMKRNPRLVYGRMTGWGQTGPLAKTAGHDINYISLTGVLHAIGENSRKPVPPLNLVGDFGGGSMLMAFGLVSGILQAKMSGKGNLVDAAMVDGAALLLAPMFGMVAEGHWNDANRGANMLDGGAPFYDTYECKDGKYVSIGSLEPKFYALLLKLGGMQEAKVMDATARWNKENWPAAKAHLQMVIKTKTRDEWCAIMENTDVCFAPVLTMTEAFDHHHARARNAFIELDGVKQPAPAPRFANNPANQPRPPPEAGEDTKSVLLAAGIDVDKLVAAGVVHDRSNVKSKL